MTNFVQLKPIDNDFFGIKIVEFLDSIPNKEILKCVEGNSIVNSEILRKKIPKYL